MGNISFLFRNKIKTIRLVIFLGGEKKKLVKKVPDPIYLTPFTPFTHLPNTKQTPGSVEFTPGVCRCLKTRL